ncbi:MAG: hypothetical protein MZV64_50470 [Ignavibacteriales bacterium]|nr:hypothetical protein [Ignavibacteriales bacterium]
MLCIKDALNIVYGYTRQGTRGPDISGHKAVGSAIAPAPGRNSLHHNLQRNLGHKLGVLDHTPPEAGSGRRNQHGHNGVAMDGSWRHDRLFAPGHWRGHLPA